MSTKYLLPLMSDEASVHSAKAGCVKIIISAIKYFIFLTAIVVTVSC